MNPGYLSWIMIFISLILLASGWKDALLRGISDRAIVLFFVGWFLGRIQLQASENLIISGSSLLFAILFVCGLQKPETWLGRLHYASVGLFLGSMTYLLKYLRDLDPFLIPYGASGGAIVILVTLAVVLVRKPVEQIGSISIAILLGHALYLYMHREQGILRLGGPSLQDEWWLTVVLARAVSAVLDTLSEHFQSAARSLSDRWKERRK